MPNLSDLLNSTNIRVNALENEGLDESAGIARITKLYGLIRINARIRFRRYLTLTPRNTLYPSSNLYSEIYFD